MDEELTAAVCLEGEDAIGSNFVASLGVVVGEDAIDPRLDTSAITDDFVMVPAIKYSVRYEEVCIFRCNLINDQS